ncbi:hypothetical protein AAG906_001157 [Vitis piasezkii]
MYKSYVSELLGHRNILFFYLQSSVLQGFGYATPNPQAQLHGLGFNSTGPQDLSGSLPQGTDFNYQAMEHPIPQLNNNHGVEFINMSTDPTRSSLPPQGPGSVVTQAGSQQLLAAADLLASTATYIKNYALALHSAAELPNLHLLLSSVLQGFGYATSNPEAQLHGLGFNSTGPQDLSGTLPQGTNFNYQAMEHTIPQLNNNHGVEFINMSTDPTRSSLPPQGPGSVVTQAGSQQLLAAADLLASTATYIKNYALALHSAAELPNLHLLHSSVLQGFGYATSNPQAQLHGLGFNSTGPQDLSGSLPQGTDFNYQAMEHPIPQLNNNHGVEFINISTDPNQTRSSLPPQGPSSNYQVMEDPTVHNYSDMFGPLIANIPNTACSDLPIFSPEFHDIICGDLPE